MSLDQQAADEEDNARKGSSQLTQLH